MVTFTRFIACSAAATFAFRASIADGQSLTTLHAFTGKSDGGIPLSGLISVGSVLYGTTSVGGTFDGLCTDTDGVDHGCGTVFRLVPATKTETVLYSFKGKSDGAEPWGGLLNQGGYFYGVTVGGGESALGTVFKFNPSTKLESVTYSFKGFLDGDGSSPIGTLIYHGGYFYGTTFGGGTSGIGTVFKVSAGNGTESPLYSFKGGADSGFPYGGVVYEGGGLYGTTTGLNAGPPGFGTVFEVNASKGGETLLHTFSGGSDGANPYGGLVVYGGIFYGAASQGGTFDGNCKVGSTDYGCGNIFSINPKTHTEAVIYSFSGKADGAGPGSSLIYSGGYLYGTTIAGGTFDGKCLNGEKIDLGCGTIFKINVSTHVETVLYRFSGGFDGSNPFAPLLLSSGDFFGTTYTGADGFGTVFKFVP